MKENQKFMKKGFDAMLDKFSTYNAWIYSIYPSTYKLWFIVCLWFEFLLFSQEIIKAQDAFLKSYSPNSITFQDIDKSLNSNLTFLI